MGAIAYVNVTGTSKNSAADADGGTKAYMQALTSGGTARTNPFAMDTAQTLGAGGMLNVADNAVSFKLGVPTIFTADAGTDTLTMTAGYHELANNDVLTLSNSGGALPAGLSAGTVYHVINAVAGTGAFQVSLTEGGSAVNITDAGTGTHTAIIPGQLTNASLITALDAVFADSDVLRFGADAAMTDYEDITDFTADDITAAVAI